MEIRLARADDIEQIAGLYIENHKITYRGLLPDDYLDRLTLEFGRHKWRRYLAEEGHRIWVANDDATGFLGFAAGMEDRELEGVWYLDSLHVTEKARGKGIGAALIRTMGKDALARGFEKMSICIVKGNDGAGRLYRRLGAIHYKDFEDRFGESISQSEKLLWEELRII